MSFKKYLAIREAQEVSGENNKDWRKTTPVIQLATGFKPPSFLQPIIQAFLDSGDIELQDDTSDAPKMKKKSIFLVGGAVRDFLRGRAPKDYDLATNATPAQIAMILCKKGGFKVRGKEDPQTGEMIPDYDRSGKEGPPMNLGFEPEIAQPGDNKVWYLTGRDSSDEKKPFVITASVNGNSVEIATFRKDAKVTDGAAVAELVDNPLDDAARRDLTINAMFIELTSPDGENKKLYDPQGGWSDITKGVVRTVGKASDRFEEDKLRIMRAIRFHCRFGKGYKMHDEIEEAIPKFLSLKGVALERVRDEFLKGLLHPDVDPKCYLSIYNRTGLLRKVFPDVRLRVDIPKQFRDKRDKPLALAWMLQDNPVEEVSRALNVQRRHEGGTKQTGWTVLERKAVEFLLKLKEFDPENIDDMMYQRKGTGLDASQIKDWVDYFNISDKQNRVRNSRPAWARQVRTFADFEDDPRERIDWQERLICPNCRGTGCPECNKGVVRGGIHPEIIKSGMAEADPRERGYAVKHLNKQRLAQKFRKMIEPDTEE